MSLAIMSRKATCIYCGKKDVFINMQHLSDVDWLRTAILSSLGMQGTADILPYKSYLCLSHFADADIITSDNGYRRARYGALPTKTDKTDGGPPILFNPCRRASAFVNGLKLPTSKISLSRRMSKRLLSNARRSNPSMFSGSTELDDDNGFDDPPPQLEISDTIAAAFALIQNFPPVDNGRRKYEIVHASTLSGNKSVGGIVELVTEAGTPTKAIYLQEFDQRSDALNELHKLRQKSDKNLLANIPETGNGPSTSSDGPHLKSIEPVQEALSEMGRIKGLLCTALQNQSEILKRLNGSTIRDPCYTYCTEREVNAIFGQYNPPLPVARVLSKRIFSVEEQALPLEERNQQKVRWLKQLIQSKYAGTDADYNCCVWAACRSALNKDAQTTASEAGLPTPSKRPNLNEMPKLLAASQEAESTAGDIKPVLQPEVKSEHALLSGPEVLDDGPPPLIDVYATGSGRK